MRPYLIILMFSVLYQSLTARTNFAITISVTVTEPTCATNNGKVVITATGGVAPYTYQMDGGPPRTSNVFLYLSAITHTITVTDAVGEVATITVTLVNQSTPPNAPTYTYVRPTGCATGDGSITLQASGGTPPYMYSLDRVNFQPNNTWTNMEAGSFWAAVRDANGCLNQFQLITANIPENCPIRHNGINESSVCNPYRSNLGLINVSGGTPPYLYSLDGTSWQTNYLFFPLPAGVHTVFVKDAAGTLMKYMVGLMDMCNPLFQLAGTATPAQCGAGNGTITVNVTSGYSPYTYSIDGTNFQASNIFTGLVPGNYTVTVKDVHDQIATEFFIVRDAGCLTITPVVVNSTCGRANGSISVQAVNGTAPYEFALGATGNFSPLSQFTNLVAGTYTIRVKDANGATGSLTVTITDLAGPTITSAIANAESCTGTDGSITITAQSGTAPYTYSMDGINFQSSPVFPRLVAGAYTAWTKDANGCLAQQPVTVTLTNTLVADAGMPVSICEGTKTMLTAQSNASQITWSPATGLSSTTTLVTEASPVSNTLYTVTASLGACIATASVLVTVDPAPVAVVLRDTTICQGKSVRLLGSGGISYQWSPSLFLDDATAMNPLVVQPPVGTHIYSLIVTDNNNCTSLVPSTVQVRVAALKINAGNDTLVHSGQPVQLQATDINNSGFLQYSWSPSTGLDDPFKINPVASLSADQVYILTAIAAGGCTAVDTLRVTVFRDIAIYVPTAFTPNEDGKNDVLKAIPVGIKEFKHLSIYDRAGHLVFKTTNPQLGWDGKYRGEKQYGIYVWYTEGIDYKGNFFRGKGTVMVIR